jgi:hypothetical protein
VSNGNVKMNNEKKQSKNWFSRLISGKSKNKVGVLNTNEEEKINNFV